MNRLKSLLIVLLICCMFSCSKNEDDQPVSIVIEEPEPEQLPNPEPIIDVYAVGYESDGVKNIAKIWENGVATALTNGANNAYVSSVFETRN